MENEVVEEQSISLQDIFFLIKKNIIMIIIITALFLIAGVVYGFKIKKPTYTGTTTAIAFVDPSSSSSTNELGSYAYASYFTSTFSSFITSDPVLNLASTKLKDNYGYEIARTELEKCVSVSTETNSLILTISAKVSSKDDTEGRKMAQAIANTVIESAVEKANTYVYNEDGSIATDEKGNYEYEYSILAKKLVIMEEVESTDDVVYKRGALMVVAISFLIGLVISCVVVLIRYFSDDTFTSKESFEKATGLSVLSVISEVTTAGGGNK